METLYIHNGRIITPMRVIDRGALLIRAGRIVAAGSAEEVQPPTTGKVLDARGAYVAPGFIETHVHGGGGSDVMDGTVDAVVATAVAHAAGGVTAMLATTLTAPMEQIVRSLEAIEAAQSLTYNGAKVVGAHIEGPYFALAQAGAQNPAYIKDPDLEEFVPVLDRFKCIRRVSVAPELRGALELGQELRRRGVIASIAHTDGTYQDVVRAVENGYTHATHMFSGMSGMRRSRAYRVAGVIEAVLTLDELTTEMIADGHHIPPSMMRMVLKTKGLHQVSITTDAMAAAGRGPGNYQLFGLDVVVEDDVVSEFEVGTRRGNYVAKLADYTAFAGSVATMDQVVRTMVEQVGLSIPDAVKMATVVPARIHGMEKERGMLSPGLAGDVVLFDDSIRVLKTVVEGRIVYDAEGA